MADAKWARLVAIADRDLKLVFETTDLDPEGRFSDDLVWVPCPAEVEQHFVYDPGTLAFAPPDAPPVVTAPPGYAPPAPPTPLAARQSAMTASVEARRDAILAGGFTVPAQVSAALAGHVLQTGTVDDKLNWLTSQAAYSAAVAAGHGSAKVASFRTLANVTVVLSYDEGLDVLLAMAGWGAAVMQRSWVLKDAVAAATDGAALDALDLAAGWPT